MRIRFVGNFLFLIRYYSDQNDWPENRNILSKYSKDFAECLPSAFSTKFKKDDLLVGSALY
jgi:hypothetical protein